MTLSRRQRWAAVVALAGVVATGAAVVTRQAPTPQPTGQQIPPAPAERAAAAPVADAARSVQRRPEQFGAVGDGRADDTAALQQALDALAPGDSLLLGADRVYLHTQVLRMSRPGTRLAGPGALLAADEERSSLQLRADDLHVEGVRLRIAATTRRWTAPDQHRLVLGRHAGLRVSGVTVDGSAGAGVYVDGTHGFALTDVVVRNSRADGIHMTGGAQDGVVSRPLLTATGDDAVAVVSYGEDDAVTRRIRVFSPTVRRTTWGRGLSVVGGQDVVYRDVDVEGSAGAAVYIATEGAPFFTRSTERVQVLGGRLRGSNRHSGIDHGAVLVAAGNDGTRVRDVRISDLSIEGTRAGATRQVGVLSYGAPVQDVELQGFAVFGGGRAYQTTAGADAVRLADWTVDGVAVPDGASPP